MKLIVEGDGPMFVHAPMAAAMHGDAINSVYRMSKGELTDSEGFWFRRICFFVSFFARNE